MNDTLCIKLTALFVISGGRYFAKWDEIAFQNVTRGMMYSMFIILKLVLLLLDNNAVKRYNSIIRYRSMFFYHLSAHIRSGFGEPRWVSATIRSMVEKAFCFGGGGGHKRT